MEFLVCMLLASIFTGGRVAQDVIATVTGNTPPHVERARLRAERERLRAERQQAAGKARSAFANGKPKIKDVAAVYWGDALQDVIDAHNRRRAEKIEQRTENEAAAEQQRPARKVRPGWKQRAARAWQLLVRPVGETGTNAPKPEDSPGQPKPATDPDPVAEQTEAADAAKAADGPVITCDDCGARLADADGGYQHPDGSTCPKAQPATSPKDAAPAPSAPAKPDAKGDGIHTCPTPDQIRQAKQAESAIRPSTRQTAGTRTEPPVSSTTEGDNMTTTATSGEAPTGEAVNYETAMAELDKLETAQQTHLDQAKAALEEIRQAKDRISDTQATYRPAAEAAGLIHQHLTALGVDQETVAATGTIADAMPPNKVDEMFNHLESMETDAIQQVQNTETALAATHAARASLVEKYGEADATVQEHLGGNPTFLAGSGTAQG